jgi:hypothetical protein
MIVTNVAGTVTSATATLTVVPIVPTLSFATIPAETYGNAAFAVSATSASSGAVMYSVVSGPATIMGSTVTLTGTGTVVLSANQAGNGNYAGASTTTSFTVAAEVPTLAFATIASRSYTCTAINSAGSAGSNAAILNVLTPTTLTITTQPSSVSVYATQTATFAVAASGTGALSYQWYTGSVGSGIPINGATTSTYTTAALTTANHATSYYVTVTDPDCTNSTETITAATVSVSGTDTAVPPTIVVQPIGQTATVGGSATFSVTASGTGTLTYQWYRVAYSSTELSNPTAGAAIVLQITAEPQTEYVAADTLASFSVSATCTGCITAYHWYW